MPEGANWPRQLDAIEAEHKRAIAEDEGRKPNPPMPLEAFSDDIDVVRNAIDVAEERCAVAEAAFAEANTVDVDWETLSRAEAEYDESVRILAALENRLEELEDESAAAERRELRSGYYRSIL